MAKRNAARPRHMPAHPVVTPMTKGASKPDFPFAIPAPRPSPLVNEETALFSQLGAMAPSTRMTLKSQFRGDNRAASARMRGAPLDDAEVDALGEADVIDPPEQEPEAEAEAVDQEAARIIEAEVARRVSEALRARMPQVATAMATATSVVAQRPRPQGALAARALVVEDTDRLWDWIRADAQSGIRFFGVLMKNSMALHHTMEALLRAEANGVGLIRSIYYEPQGGALGVTHLGFVMLAPILSAEQIAIAHIYLKPDVRGRLDAFLPSLLQLAANDMPGFKIAVLPADAAQARLYRGLLGPLGFSEHVVFVR